MGEHLWSQELIKDKKALPFAISEVKRRHSLAVAAGFHGNAAAGSSAVLQRGPSRSAPARHHTLAEEAAGRDANWGETCQFL